MRFIQRAIIQLWTVALFSCPETGTTIALLYKAAEEAADAEDKDQALDCYRMVYDLTADEEIGKRIAFLEAR